MEIIKGIILLGGEGQRFGQEVPKQFVRLAGKPLYEYALETFLSIAAFDEIIVVCHPDWLALIQTKSRVRVIPGGRTRQESSYKGLLACGEETDIVVIHDGVRPFVSRAIIEANIEGARLYGAVDTCIPSADTLVHAPTKTTVAAIPNRSEFLRGQTPQSFSYPLIRQAHECTKQEATDDCRLVLEQGHPVHITQGSEDNIKITTELDLVLAEQIVRHTHLPSSASPTTLTGKTYAVIGGCGGIGSAICTSLETLGAKPLPLSRQTGFDITQDRLSGEIDGLIIAAGRLKTGPIASLSTEEIEEQIAVNLTGAIRCCKEACIRPGGHIVTIASSAYSRGRAGYAVYSAAKAAVVNFTQALAEERPDLKVNCVVPSRTDTPLRRDNFPDNGTLLDPTDVAKAVITTLKSGKTGGIEHVRQGTASLNPQFARLQ